MEIRPYAAADRAGFLELYRECRTFYGLAPLEAALEARLADLLARERHVSGLLAWDGGRPLGFATWALLFPAGDGPALFMKELFVAESARGHGAGRALVDIAVAEDCSRLDWNADLDQPAALRFYDGLGAGQRDKVAFYRVPAEGFAAFRARLDA